MYSCHLFQVVKHLVSFAVDSGLPDHLLDFAFSSGISTREGNFQNAGVFQYGVFRLIGKLQQGIGNTGGLYFPEQPAQVAAILYINTNGFHILIGLQGIINLLLIYLVLVVHKEPLLDSGKVCPAAPENIGFYCRIADMFNLTDTKGIISRRYRDKETERAVVWMVKLYRILYFAELVQIGIQFFVFALIFRGFDRFQKYQQLSGDFVPDGNHPYRVFLIHISAGGSVAR